MTEKGGEKHTCYHTPDNAAEAKEQRQNMRTVMLASDEYTEPDNDICDGSLEAGTEDNTEDSKDTCLSPDDLDTTLKQKVTLKGILRTHPTAHDH